MSLPKEGDRRRVTLSCALVEVSGKPLSKEESQKVISALPIPIMERVYIIYIGSLDKRRLVTATSLWSAPTAADHNRALVEEEKQKNKLADEAEKQMESRFGKQAIEEEKALGREILKKSGYKGAIKMTQDSLAELQDEEEN